MVCDKKGIELLSVDVTPSTVHVYMDIPPVEAVNTAVRNMKRVTAHVLRDEFPVLRSRLPSLWTLHYFVSTEDDFSQEKANAWINSQPRFVKHTKKGK